MTQALYRQRKYTLALMFTFSLIVGLFTGIIDGAVFVAGATLVLGMYNAGNVGQTWAENKGKE
mgnify:CR=1 FL=1